MRVSWWQAGVYIEPTTEAERSALFSLTLALNLIEPIHQVVPGPIRAVDIHDQNPIVRIDESPQVISQGHRIGDLDPSSPLREKDAP